MFRFILTSVALMVTLVLVNASSAGNPTRTTNKAPVTGQTSKSVPVHGPGSSHDPRSPVSHPGNYNNWGHHSWNSHYGCENYWSLEYGCYFYFYAPANCFYPISAIDEFPPVCTPAAAVVVVPHGGHRIPVDVTRHR